MQLGNHSIFPNGILGLRLALPRGPLRTEFWHFVLVDRDAPEAIKRVIRVGSQANNGAAGMFEQDDVENWVSITKVSQGTMAQRLHLNSRMGLTSDDVAINQRLPGFSGPGVARVGYSEFNQRDWLTIWSSHLTGGPIERTHPLVTR